MLMKIQNLNRDREVVLTEPTSDEFARILSPEAPEFVAALGRRFGDRWLALLRRRKTRQKQLDAGELPDFLAETANIRAGDWQIAGTPADLEDRRVEITGPPPCCETSSRTTCSKRF